MKVEILISGFGGQGIMSSGKILARAAMKEDKHTTYFPSYGAEMRGGTAHCFVKISDSDIASPFIENPDIAVIFNQPSLERFGPRLKEEGLLVLNSDFIDDKECIKGRNVKEVSLAMSKAALECGSIKSANIIALGIVISLMPDIAKGDTIIEVLKETFSAKALESNLKAFEKGRAEKR